MRTKKYRQSNYLRKITHLNLIDVDVLELLLHLLGPHLHGGDRRLRVLQRLSRVVRLLHVERLSGKKKSSILKSGLGEMVVHRLEGLKCHGFDLRALFQMKLFFGVSPAQEPTHQLTGWSNVGMKR